MYRIKHYINELAGAVAFSRLSPCKSSLSALRLIQTKLRSVRVRRYIRIRCARWDRRILFERCPMLRQLRQRLLRDPGVREHFWHVADIDLDAQDVRFWHIADSLKRLASSPLSGVKRTCRRASTTSANDPERTSKAKCGSRRILTWELVSLRGEASRASVYRALAS